MKKVKMNAKLFLAVAAMASVTLTSCEKEDFTVDVPNIEITNPDVKPDGLQDGIIFVQLSASSTDGSLLNGVTFTYSDGSVAPEMIAISGKDMEAPKTLSLVAKKDGFEPASKEIVIPVPVKGTMMTLPINFVLTKIDVEEEVVSVIEGVVEESEEPIKIIQNAPTPIDGWQVEKTYTAVVQVPTSAPFITDEQKQYLYKEIENNIKIEGAGTRVDVAVLDVVKAKLKAAVDSYSNKPANSGIKITFKLTEEAKNVRFIVNATTYTQGIKFSTEVDGKTYYVQGGYSFCGMSSIETEADGITIGHGHAHGDDNNAGGGTTGKA